MEGGRIVLKDYLINSEKMLEAHCCPICSSILYNPIMCGNCECLFCTDCIKDFIINRESCFTPHCTFSEMRITKMIYKVLDSLNFRCLNSKEGCMEISNYTHFFNHSCTYVTEQCKFCGIQKLKREIEQHMQNCDLASINCDVCMESFSKKEIDSHSSENCLKSVLLRFKKEQNDLKSKIFQEDCFKSKRIELLEEENLKLKEKVQNLETENTKIIDRLEGIQLNLKETVRNLETQNIKIIQQIEVMQFNNNKLLSKFTCLKEECVESMENYSSYRKPISENLDIKLK
jgi:hypothetical protein